jgi:fatty-acyl-CoA synthase
MDLVAEGFDPAKVRDPLFFRGPKGYQKITRPLFAKIVSGELRL